MRTLLGIFQTLIGHGGHMAVIEHDLDVIRNADYLIDMGPGGGESRRTCGGGRDTGGGCGEYKQYHRALFEIEISSYIWRSRVIGRIVQ